MSNSITGDTPIDDKRDKSPDDAFDFGVRALSIVHDNSEGQSTGTSNVTEEQEKGKKCSGVDHHGEELVQGYLPLSEQSLR